MDKSFLPDDGTTITLLTLIGAVVGERRIDSSSVSGVSRSTSSETCPEDSDEPSAPIEGAAGVVGAVERTGSVAEEEADDVTVAAWVTELSKVDNVREGTGRDGC